MKLLSSAILVFFIGSYAVHASPIIDLGDVTADVSATLNGGSNSPSTSGDSSLLYPFPSSGGSNNQTPNNNTRINGSGSVGGTLSVNGPEVNATVQTSHSVVFQSSLDKDKIMAPARNALNYTRAMLEDAYYNTQAQFNKGVNSVTGLVDGVTQAIPDVIGLLSTLLGVLGSLIGGGIGGVIG